MNLYKNFNQNEIQLLKQAGINVQDKDFCQ